MTRVLLPGRILRHIADVEDGNPHQHPDGVYYPTWRLCNGLGKLENTGFLTQHCEDVESADLASPFVCPLCLAAHQPAVDVDETMGTIPLFDL
mgnify:FL=1